MGFPGGTVVENPPTNAEPHGEGCYPVWGLAGTCSCGLLAESSCWTLPAPSYFLSFLSPFLSRSPEINFVYLCVTGEHMSLHVF